MLAQIRRSIILAVVALVLFGLVYPLVGTGLAQLLFPHQADGSLTANGSTLIGQSWSSPGWFHGRPDDFGPYAARPEANPPVAGGDDPLRADGNAGESGTTNLGPRSKVLLTDTAQLIAWWHAQGVQPTTDLVTTSGSGLDPDITPADARAQIPMILRHRPGLTATELRSLIDRQTHPPPFGFLGSPYIVVLELNEGLAQLR